MLVLFIGASETMKVSELREMLLEFPQDASVELGKLFAITRPPEEKIPDGKPFEPDREDITQYEVILDFPIVGMAYHAGDNDMRFIVEHADELSAFGKVKPLIG